MSRDLASSLSPKPASMSTVRPAARTTTGRTARAIRFWSSAGARRDQSTFGTVPNIAPPSSRKRPSRIGSTSRSPIRTHGLLQQLDEDAARAGGMKERDLPAARAWARTLVDEAQPPTAEHAHHRGKVVDHETQMMKTRAAAV